MSQQPRKVCQRCRIVPPQWFDLAAPARTAMALLELRRDVDVPATPGDAHQLGDYIRHLPHTTLTWDQRQRRARVYLGEPPLG